MLVFYILQCQYYRNDGCDAASYKLCSFCDYPSFVVLFYVQGTRSQRGDEVACDELIDLLTDSF